MLFKSVSFKTISVKKISAKSFMCAAVVVLLQACGGGGSNGGSTPDSSAAAVSSAATSLSSSISSSSVSKTSSSSSSVNSSLSSSTSSLSSSKSSSSTPADFPVGTVDALPVLNLNTNNAAPIVSKVDYLPGSFTLSDVGAADVTGTLEVRGRGNSTWGWSKKPYRLKLTNSTSLLGMPKGKSWVLLANYADKTLMRNDIAFMFSRSLGFEWTPRAQYVELKLNGVYEGVYQLVEQIRVDTNRVNIDEMKVGDISQDKVSGGYLLQIDFRHNVNYCVGSGWDPVCVNGVNTARNVDYCLDSTHGMEPACLESPETLQTDPTWVNQKLYIDKYYADFEAALFGPNFTDPTVGYAAYVDVDSVINYYLENEIFKNVDGSAASFYLYKKRGGKLFFGPIWDFDLSMGNAGYDDVDKTDGWHIRYNPNFPNVTNNIWFTQLFKDPAFVAKVKARWKTLKDEGKLEYIFQYAQARATWLDKQQKKNFLTWSITDTETDINSWVRHGTNGGTGSYEAEVAQLIKWQRARVVWMDTQFQ